MIKRLSIQTTGQARGWPNENELAEVGNDATRTEHQAKAAADGLAPRGQQKVAPAGNDLAKRLMGGRVKPTSRAAGKRPQAGGSGEHGETV